MSDHPDRSQAQSSENQAPHDLIVAPYPASLSNELVPLPVNSMYLNSLNTLLKAITNILPNAQPLNGTYFLKFTPEIAKKLSAGTYTVMQSSQGGLRAVAIDAHGRIVGQGTLVATTGLQMTTLALAAWQVLAVITAQHYLPDIQRRLIALENNIQDVKAWMEAHDKARLLSSLNYLRDLHVEFNNAPLTNERRIFWSNHLEAMYLNIDHLVETYRLKLDHQIKQFADLNPHDWFGAARIQREITMQLDQNESMAITFSSALVVKMVTIEQLAQLNDYTALNRHRLTNIPNDIQELRKHIEICINVAENKLSSIGGPIDLWKQDAEQRTIIFNHIIKFKQRISQRIFETLKIAHAVTDQLDQHKLLKDQGQSFIILMHQGEVAQIYTRNQQLQMEP